MRYFALKHRDRPDRRVRRLSRRGDLSCESLESRDMPAAGPLGINVLPQYVDAMKQAQDWSGPRDANGWPLNDSSVAVIDDRVNQPWNGPDPNAVPPDDGGTYHLSFNGQATIGGFPIAQIQNQV